MPDNTVLAHGWIANLPRWVEVVGRSSGYGV
jgi:trans-2-enoyl-CoA reductase